MARPKKKGIEYFPFDVDFFSDKKIRVLKGRFGADGITIYLYLLCEIYRNGYYVQMDEDYEYIIADDLGMSNEKVKQVLKFLLERSLLDSTLFQSDTIITSQGIQRRFQEAIKTRASKSEIRVEQKYWLLKENETQPFIKFTLNPSYSEKNPSYSEKNYTKESKVKESKVKETICESEPVSADSMFNIEQAWKDTFEIYPKKSGAVMAHTVWMDKLIPVIESNRKDVAILILCATQMYIDDYKEKNPNDTAFQFIPKYENWLKNDCDYWIQQYEESLKIVNEEE